MLYKLLIASFALCGMLVVQARSSLQNGNSARLLMRLLEELDTEDKRQAEDSTNYWEGWDDLDFQCLNGEMTDSDYVCDGDNDCGDCTDEEGCDEPCVPGQWRADEFQCGNGGSVPQDWLCDGDNDCGDCSDEGGEGCEEECDDSYEYEFDEQPDFPCDNGNVTYSDYVCDGDNDCGDCSDETGCDTECVPGLFNHDDFVCTNGNGPFPADWQCDGWNDCGDCSDEPCDEVAEACEGTEEGENFAARGGYLRKRSNAVRTKTHNYLKKKRGLIQEEKREHLREKKMKSHAAMKRSHKKGQATHPNTKRNLKMKARHH